MLNWLVDRLHVSTPDAEVRAHIRRRLRPALGATERRALLAKAVRIHRRNQRLYARVMGGRL